MEDIKELQNRLELLEPARDKVWNEYLDKSAKNIPFEVAWKWYCNQSVIKECKAIEDKIRKLKPADYFEPIDKDDDVYTIEKFIGMCKGGRFIDYDGFGVYAFEDKKSNIEIYPSDVIKGNLRTDFTHIVWYNR